MITIFARGTCTNYAVLLQREGERTSSDYCSIYYSTLMCIPASYDCSKWMNDVFVKALDCP